MAAKILFVLSALVALATSSAKKLQRISAQRLQEPEAEDSVVYQQIGVDEDGRLIGGGCLNWDEAKMADQGEDGMIKEKKTLDECAKKCKETDGCKEFMHCSGRNCANSDAGDETGFCALAKSHCFIRPNMKHQWMTYRFLPDCNDELEKEPDTSDYVCPLGELKSDLYKGYYKSLHCTMINGNAVYHGMRDLSFAERWMRYYHKELECAFMKFIDDKQDGGPCGGLPSQFDSRKVQWEKYCLSAGKAAQDVFTMMSKEEKMYWFKTKNEMKTSQAFSTLLDLVGDKELVCMQMKLTDDMCGGFRKPRMLSPNEAKKMLRPPRKEKAICKGLKFKSAKGGPCGYSEDEEEEEEPHTGEP